MCYFLGSQTKIFIATAPKRTKKECAVGRKYLQGVGTKNGNVPRCPAPGVWPEQKVKNCGTMKDQKLELSQADGSKMGSNCSRGGDS